MIRHVIAVLVIVLALVLYVRKLRTYFAEAHPDADDAGQAHAHRARHPALRTSRPNGRSRR